MAKKMRYGTSNGNTGRMDTQNYSSFASMDPNYKMVPYPENYPGLQEQIDWSVTGINRQLGADHSAVMRGKKMPKSR